MAQSGWTDKRPMSPHLQVWRWHITMLGSILHRVTGIGNYLGAFLATGWLFAASSGRETYDAFAGLAGSLLGQLVLFGFTWSVSYHLLNGLRHLVLDSGIGLDPKGAGMTSTLVLAGSFLLAGGVWAATGLVGDLFAASGTGA